MRALWLDRRPALLAGAVALVGSVALGIALPAFDVLLSGWSDTVQFGVLLVLSSGVRLVAGLYAGRSLRRRDGLTARGDAVPSAALGALVAAVVYAVLIVALGGGVPLWRWLVEVLRWGAEAALGAFVVTPGERDDVVLLRRLERQSGRW